MQRLLSLALLAGLGLSSSGCTTPPVRHDGVEVRIVAGHVHSRYCGHYLHEGVWYYVRAHNHGVHCGHYLKDGIWVIER